MEGVKREEERKGREGEKGVRREGEERGGEREVQFSSYIIVP